MIRLSSKLNTLPVFSHLLDKIEDSQKQDEYENNYIYIIAFFDRLFNHLEIDAVDVSEADEYAFPFNDDRIESVFNDTDTGLKIRTETDNVVIDVADVCPSILCNICKYLCNTDIIKIGVTR